MADFDALLRSLRMKLKRQQDSVAETLAQVAELEKLVK